MKDNLDTIDMPTSSGVALFKDFVPRNDAFVVARLRAAGAIILAKSSLSELAMGLADSINSVLPGFTRNPYNTAYASGGSSGGTGVAVAADFGTAGIGTDTGGSVRAPSSINNLVGIRPTVGLVSRTGMGPLDSQRDTPGPMARSVEDVARLLDVMAGVDPADARTASAEGKHLADLHGISRQERPERCAHRRLPPVADEARATIPAPEPPMIADTPLFARVSHRFTASAERVYDAFLDVSTARRFLYASLTGEIVRAELDPRVGGGYVLTDRRDGADVEHSGTFLELDRPRRLVFTMFVPGYSTSPDRVLVDIVPLESGCELTLTHEMAPDYAPFVDATVSAYTEHLKRLEAVLA